MRNAVDLRSVEFLTSSFCSHGGCVELGRLPDGTVALRDTKDRARPPLVFTPREWDDFAAGVRNGEFDVS